ncbi:hypothetical protein ACI2K4_24410 [Micromonospora sp. NPDC050397]|uniref:hypothetical protein n=1 Tax=Micromonospora sp. NPDC050397 TaxID=3364279 RepID=UPI00384D2D75
MTFDLLLDQGVLLPSALPLAFGLQRVEVLDVCHAADIHDVFVCGTVWAIAFETGGIIVTMSAATARGLDAVSFRRTDSAVGTMPVALDNVDLFGWPTDDVVTALADSHLVERPAPTNAWIDHRRVLLHCDSSDGSNNSARRRPKRAPTPYFDFACLYSPHHP